MRNYKQILEAINRGINLALDDFDDNEPVSVLKTGKIINKNHTKEYLVLMNIVVDLGLPSGTLWCKYNLDVNSDKLDVFKDWYGGYYAWGEIEDKSKKGKDYNWRTYKFSVAGLHDNLTKYVNNKEYGADNHGKWIVDNLTLLQPEDDIAYQNMHCHNFKFHIPTLVDFEELKKYTTKEWVEDFDPYNKKIIRGLNGMIFKSKINGKEIFFPAAGGINAPSYYDFGEYWSANIFNTESDKAWAMHIEYDTGGLGNLCYIHAIKRMEGYSIRPVVNM